jgi:hypothetical protein
VEQVLAKPKVKKKKGAKRLEMENERRKLKRMLIEELTSSPEFQNIKDTIMGQMFNFDLTDEQLDKMPARKFIKMIDSQKDAMR